mmetsp:Transcript_4176/g.10477  ORF Transcript_4176/g.10477 Transcript_4176/m.10477 type:complete len:206 (-) Transcript_4176:238-855(-)
MDAPAPALLPPHASGRTAKGKAPQPCPALQRPVLPVGAPQRDARGLETRLHQQRVVALGLPVQPLLHLARNSRSGRLVDVRIQQGQVRHVRRLRQAQRGFRGCRGVHHCCVLCAEQKDALVEDGAVADVNEGEVVRLHRRHQLSCHCLRSRVVLRGEGRQRHMWGEARAAVLCAQPLDLRLQLLRELACRLDPQAVLPHPGVCFC